MWLSVIYHARRWVKRWSGLTCSELSSELISELRNERSEISNQTANKELRYLRSLFNWGITKKFIADNPASRVEMMRVEKRSIYVPTHRDIKKVFEVASEDQKDYLWCLRDTLARSREINNLKWNDINFKEKHLTLFTRKKKHGTKTPRNIPMTQGLCERLVYRFEKHHSKDIPWVFGTGITQKRLGEL